MRPMTPVEESQLEAYLEDQAARRDQEADYWADVAEDHLLREPDPLGGDL